MAGFEIACGIARFARKIGRFHIIKTQCGFSLSLNIFHKHLILHRIFFNCRVGFYLYSFCEILQNCSIIWSCKKLMNFFERLWKNIVNFFKDGRKKNSNFPQSIAEKIAYLHYQSIKSIQIRPSIAVKTCEFCQLV